MGNRNKTSVRLIPIYATIVIIAMLVLGVVLRKDLFRNFGPQSWALSGSEKLLAFHVASDCVIAFCFSMIAIFLFYVVKSKKELLFRGAVFALAVSLALSAINYTFNAANVWVTFYWLDAFFKGVTAISAVAIVVTLPGLARVVRELKTPEEYQKFIDSNRELSRQIQELKEWKQS